MKMKKKLLTAAVSLTLAASMVTPAFASEAGIADVSTEAVAVETAEETAEETVIAENLQGTIDEIVNDAEDIQETKEASETEELPETEIIEGLIDVKNDAEEDSEELAEEILSDVESEEISQEEETYAAGTSEGTVKEETALASESGVKGWQKALCVRLVFSVSQKFLW